MTESILIDYNILKEVSLSLKEFLFLYQLYLQEDIVEINSEEKEQLQNKQFIKILEKEIILRQESIELINFLLTDSKSSFIKKKKKITKSTRKINQEVDDRVDEYRFKWKGFKTGAMGSPKSCKQKLTRWMKENPKYSFDDILKAADLYIDSIENPRFMQRADYFIFKHTINKEEESRLSAFIEDIDKSQAEGDWTSTLL